MKNKASLHAIKPRSKARRQVKVSGKKILSAPFSYYFLLSASKRSQMFFYPHFIPKYIFLPSKKVMSIVCFSFKTYLKYLFRSGFETIYSTNCRPCLLKPSKLTTDLYHLWFELSQQFSLIVWEFIIIIYNQQLT